MADARDVPPLFSRSLVAPSHAPPQKTTKPQKKTNKKTKTAYYLKYRNLRPAYVEAVLGTAATATTNATDGLIDWAVVSANYDRVSKAAAEGGDAALLAAAGEIGQA